MLYLLSDLSAHVPFSSDPVPPAFLAQWVVRVHESGPRESRAMRSQGGVPVVGKSTGVSVLKHRKVCIPSFAPQELTRVLSGRFFLLLKKPFLSYLRALMPF